MQPPHLSTILNSRLARHVLQARAPEKLARAISQNFSDTTTANLTGLLTTSPNYTIGLAGVDQVGNYFFVNALVIFFFVLCGFSLFLRLATMGNSHLRHLFAAGGDAERQAYFTSNHTAWWPFVKRHVLYAPTWKTRHNREIQLSTAVSFGTLPSRFHTVLLGVYVVSNIVYCTKLNYHHNSRAAVLAELRGRSGSLAVINLIPTMLFALRNNPLIPLLKVSYDTFNLLHRWTARIVIVEAVVHTVAWAVNFVDIIGFKHMGTTVVDSMFLWWGTISTLLLIVIALQAWSPIRHAFYETFINVHRIMVLVTLIGIYIHIDKGKLPQLRYIQLAFGFWAAEWILRSLRILFLNYSRSQGWTTVTVQALPSETCCVTFDLVRPWVFRPGCNVHVYLPRVGLWSSHPFSVAWTEDAAVGPVGEKIAPAELELDARPRTRTSVSLVMRARTGMTRALFARASVAPGGTLTLQGAVEGPYGGHESLDSYGTVLLFAGGVGITHQLGYVRHLLAGAAAGTVATRRLALVWSVPNTEALEWVRPWMDEILRMKGRRDVLRVLLFVTKPRSQQEIVSGTGTVRMFPGRCNPQTLVDKEFVDRVGAMAVTVCGPGSFADSVRQAVRKRVELGSVDFVEEAFTY